MIQHILTWASDSYYRTPPTYCWVQAFEEWVCASAEKNVPLLPLFLIDLDGFDKWHKTGAVSLCCHYFCAVVHVKRYLHRSPPGLNAYWFPLPRCLRGDGREAEWEKNTLFSTGSSRVYGEMAQVLVSYQLATTTAVNWMIDAFHCYSLWMKLESK